MFHVENVKLKEQHCCRDGEKLISQRCLESVYYIDPHSWGNQQFTVKREKALGVRTNQCVWPT